MDCSLLVTEHFCFWCFFWFDSVAVCEIFCFFVIFRNSLQDFRSPHARPEDKNSTPSAHPHLRELYEGSSRQLHTQMERLSKAQIGRLGRRVSIHQMAGVCLCKYASCLSFHDFSWHYYSDKNVWCNQKRSLCTHHPPQIYRNVQLSYTFLTISTVHSFCCCRQVDLQKQVCQEVLLLIMISLDSDQKV